MIRDVLLGLMLASLVAGCICNYEAVVSTEISDQEVPARVLKAFYASYPTSEVRQILRHEHSGRPVGFKFYFMLEGRGLNAVQVAPNGDILFLGPQESLGQEFPPRESARVVRP